MIVNLHSKTAEYSRSKKERLTNLYLTEFNGDHFSMRSSFREERYLGLFACRGVSCSWLLMLLIGFDFGTLQDSQVSHVDRSRADFDCPKNPHSFSLRQPVYVVYESFRGQYTT